MKVTNTYLICYGKEPTALKLMPDFRVVLCEYLVGAQGVYLWIEQSLVTSREAVNRSFIIARPGKSVPESYQYVDSAIDPFGSRAHHVFQLPAQAADPHSLSKGKWRVFPMAQSPRLPEYHRPVAP
ncbi:DUF7352 domain-containing protein [Marinobacter sp. F4206]|uniref:DUF7352 domain-containing protein n=1 Tax=Marinobacter sp. F4206 TaxID=2861777 RepID=UPI001C5D21BB|nr:hypothetical protein [Marinobacter sp. F4206]MBW4934121.1 hypothetical protein [Marinobacter sp. F4206]